MQPKRVIIIGAVALGPKVACRLKRLRPDFEVTMVDQGEYISYGGCGIPYYISGDLSDIKELMSTSFHMLRTPEFFEGAKDVRVKTRTRALAIDRENRQVRVLDLVTGQEENLPYDHLVLATGSRPRPLPVPGADLPGVMRVSNLPAAMAVRDKIAKGEVGRVVIIGAGAIGVEMAEAVSDLWGLETSLVEVTPQILPGVLEPGLARMVAKHLQDKGVTLHLEESVQEIRPHSGAEASLEVVTALNVIPADLVIIAVGAAPNTELARQAGLAVSAGGGIVVNPRLQTSDPAHLRRRRLHRQPPPHHRQTRLFPLGVARQPAGTRHRHQPGRGFRHLQRHRRLLHPENLRSGHRRHRPQSRRRPPRGL